MNIEYEVRVLDINRDYMIKKLEEVGCTFKWDLLQRRYVYDFNPVEENKWIRLRTNGKKTTLTIKKINNLKIDGTEELEIKVDDFDKTNELLNELGYVARNYQENRRRQYFYDDIEIDIDDWPLIPTYLEIEGKNEESVYKMIELLGIEKESVTTKDVATIYSDYGIKINKIKTLKLEEERI